MGKKKSNNSALKDAAIRCVYGTPNVKSSKVTGSKSQRPRKDIDGYRPDVREQLKSEHNRMILELLEAEKRRESQRAHALSDEPDAEIKEEMKNRFQMERNAFNEKLAGLKKEYFFKMAQLS